MREHTLPVGRHSGLIIFRVIAGVLVTGALIHVSTVVPRVIALIAALDELPAAAWILAGAYAVSALTALLACALAALLLWKAADRAAARALVLFLAFLATFWGSLFHVLNVNAEHNELSEVTSVSINASLSFGGDWVSSSALFAVVLAAAAFVRFSALFPRPLTADALPPARWFRRLRSIRVALLRGRVVWASAFGALLVVEVAPEVIPLLLRPSTAPEGGASAIATVMLSVAALTFGILPLGALVLGTRNLRSSYRIATDADRRRILWVVSGFSTASWMVLCAIGLLLVMVTLDIELGAFEALGAAIPLALFLAPFVVVVCAAMGILRSGAMDPALVLQRSAFYGPLGALGVVAFAGLESALSTWVVDRLGLPGVTGSVLAGALVAAALIPVRRPLKHLGLRYVRRLATVDETPRSRAKAQVERISQDAFHP